MALKPPSSKKPAVSEEEIERVIAGGNSTRGDAGPVAQVRPASPSKDVSFTMTIPAGMAVLIDAHREPTRTSRRAWLLQAAEEKLKREGLM